MVRFYLLATGWIFDISVCDNSMNLQPKTYLLLVVGQTVGQLIHLVVGQTVGLFIHLVVGQAIVLRSHVTEQSNSLADN